MMNNDALLAIQSLRTCFQTPAGIARAVDGVSLNVHESQVLGIVGESGCGKSVLSLSILRLLPMPPAFFDGGAIFFRGRNLLDLSMEELRSIRGNEISMIFQEPMTALNPVFTVGDQLAEVYRVHRGLSRKEAWQRAIGMLERVGVPAPESRVREYPFQLSGGMRQRVMIAMALACRPKLLIADEPTTALDVTIQAQILDLMEKLKEEMGTAIILISHDLGVIAEMAQEVAVMYTGRVVERADTLELFDHPLHPYTRGLMQAIPGPDMSMADGELYEIPGVVPSLTDLPQGCSFHPRCALADEICRTRPPDLTEVRPGHWAACWMVTGGAHA
jgi:oligopeptide/dipeptide ABC transporter ATP-binding protein